MVDALDSKSSFFGSVGSIPTQGTDKQLQGSPEGAAFYITKCPQALLEWAFCNVKGYRRSLALKLFSKCSQWEDGLHRPSSPTHKLEWAFVFYQMHRRSLALKLFSTCSQWEDGLHRPSSPTHKLEWVFFNIRLVSKSDRHPDGSLLRNQSGIRQG